MSSKLFSLRPVLFAAALSGLLGIGIAQAKTDFVGDVSGLTPVEQNGFDAAVAKAGALPKGFTSVYVAPVGVIAGQDERLDGMTDYDRNAMEDYLYRQLTRQLGKKFSLASAAGAGVLVVDAKFTALTPNQPVMSDYSKVSGLDPRSFGIGKAGVQIELRDGGSGELLAALADHEEGDPLNTNLNTVAVWGDAQEFARAWADSLSDLL
jgi:hypothetical protein